MIGATRRSRLQGLPVTIKAAHMKLLHSLMPFVRAYFRETQELVFDAHDKAFEFYGGDCQCRIYDNNKTLVAAILVGKARKYNNWFLQMCSHHLADPVDCSPASGWEKSQLENQVDNLRHRVFLPEPRVKWLAELNAWISDQCIIYAKTTMLRSSRTGRCGRCFRMSAPAWSAPAARLTVIEKTVRATTTGLIMVEHNRYSVDASAAGQMVLVCSHAERIVALLGKEIVAEHERQFKRDQVIHNPRHYLPILLRKPDALRNGAPFKDWDLPAGLAEMRDKLRRHVAGIASGDVILTIIARTQ